ncbi:YvrJ family protein [Sporomusa acidovorans]|uniref:YvrJ protein family protein n=1 Tax=Sporomusa acidovorans (strain ATCC 49682 / DSM 3132 / Mol) TaxID=1123286 RepID=A0ABZ3J6X8_SPOA4|nr:YvrJ family protein [Sporomusa acidovorans]OZC19402.1 YvrJ protein family protein [Sporomusa acidovorans DSM 3132]SDD77889.1 YvrJ protein family protein [Sporomusa acidovorans]
MEQLLSYASSYGFPMVVAAYLLVRIEGRLENLAASINDLAKILAERL